MKAKGIDGTRVFASDRPARPRRRAADRSLGLPGRRARPRRRQGDPVSMWYSIELQATTPVPEWNGQPVRMAQEEDAIIGADGKVRWALSARTSCS